MELILKLIIFLPLVSGIANGIFCKKISNKKAGFIASTAMMISAVCAFIIFTKAGIDHDTMHIVLGRWIKIGAIHINWSLYVDQLTAIMFLLVTIVSTVVHIYSLGYMQTDKNLPKFLSYLSFFTFCMLALVSSDNFLQLFFGWEGVGLCSYLLIGYYYQKDAANNAALKAFIVNRVGDFAFIIGIVIIIIYTDSVNFERVFALAPNLAALPFDMFGLQYSVLDLICLMLFIGCMGKSAQIGMHIWLPDAMEGPAPVSALIHAATMVTAGVFLIARCSFMFEYSPQVLQIVTIVGAVTCLFAALVAIAQTDIKKIIAYSTCSQLGYMFFACGVSAYQTAMFHLVTHGFFKALLFLSAGSVIHACHEQDIFKMGGLRTKMPLTYANFWIGSLAIMGIFPFAGFYSKDHVLEAAYLHDGAGQFAFIFGTIAALFTAIYSLKILIVTFHGKTKLSKTAYEHAHESPIIMNLPLLVLTAGAMFSGMLGYYILQINNPYGFFSGSIFHLNISDHEQHIAMGIEMLPLIIGTSGMLFGYYIYKNSLYNTIVSKMRFMHYILQNKFFFDELYTKLFVKPVSCISKITQLCDSNIIDKFGPNGLAMTTRIFSWCTCQIQTGYIFNYVFYIVFALVVCITTLIVKYLQMGGV